jgi:D-amino-acid dehydrogenase
VIGLFSAYYLMKSGHQVTIIDKGNLEKGCSHGNAGMIVPSHVMPMAAPGMISQGMRWMLSADSPFYVRPRMSSSLFSWGMKFYRSATMEHVAKSIPALRDLSFLSKELYQDLARENNDFLYDEKGLLMLFRTDKTGAEEIEVAEVAQKAGLEVGFLSKDEVRALETGVATSAIGGVHYKSDAHLSPNKLMAFLKHELTALGVKWMLNTTVLDFEKKENKIVGIITSTGKVLGDEFVISGGAWSLDIARKTGLKLSLLPGKGYSFTLTKPIISPSIPSILCEGKVAVTPMGDKIRFGGTLEITHTNDTIIRPKRVQGIVKSINDFYPTMNIETPKLDETWFGFRPCSPDGLPYIGRCDEAQNLYCATGHAMMGLSLGPATGKLIEEMINQKDLSVNTHQFQPNRKF